MNPPATNKMQHEQTPLIFTVEPAQAGQRLDVFLGAHLTDISRSQIAKLAQDGHVTVNGKSVKPSLKLKSDEVVNVVMPQAVESQYLPEDIPLDILYEDADILVINKPAGLVVHPAPGHDSGTLVNAVLHHCPDLGAIAGEIRPGIVHRLDQDTSGAMVVAKNAPALEHLAAQFKGRQTQKAYLALVLGNLDGHGTVDLAIGRAMNDRKKMSVTSKHSREALTKWQALKNFNGVTLLKVRILTGRTHQIRVHLTHLRHPVIGDTLYGVPNLPQVLPNYGLKDGKLLDILKHVQRQLLHAWKLSFSHPVSGEWLQFSAPIPADMADCLAQLETYLTTIDPDNQPLDISAL